MKFTFAHGLIWISFDLVYGGETIKIDNCVLDTGSATTAIDIDLVDLDYGKPATVKRIFGIGGGSQEVIAQRVDSLIINGKELSDIEIEFGDMQTELQLNGFIGNDVLRNFSVMIDYPKQEIQFSE